MRTGSGTGRCEAVAGWQGAGGTAHSPGAGTCRGSHRHRGGAEQGWGRSEGGEEGEGASRVFGVASNMLEMKGGISRCEYVTLLPPGEAWMARALLTFGIDRALQFHSLKL